jgi:hypothetical protein
LAAMALCLGGCGLSRGIAAAITEGVPSTAQSSADLDALAQGLTGHFTSAGQAARDADFLHIELRAVRIWQARTDGIWLYVEQAAGWALDRPYRQRLYQLTQPEPGQFTSAVYLLPGDDPLEFAGAWENPSAFDGLDPSSADPRTGCEIHLVRRADGVFQGRTSGEECPSSLGDAAYATSAVLVSPTAIFSWDRGWSESDFQVWGAETGPYLFERQG